MAVDPGWFEKNLAERTFIREGCEIHYWISNKDAGSWLCFLHGACADHRMFLDQLPAVAESYNVLLWDARGHGLSRPTSAYSADLLIEDLLAILDQEECAHITLIGQSAGGNLAQGFVRAHPDRVERLVIIGSTWNWQRLGFGESLAIRMTSAILALYPWNLLLEQSATNTAVQSHVQAYARECFAALGKREFVRNFSGVAGFLREDESYRIGKPILLVHGERDATGNIRKVAPLFAAAEPRCRYEVLPGAGHAANMDVPEGFNRILLDFLAGESSFS